MNKPANDRRFWPRPAVHVHVLGEIKYVFVGQCKIRALMLYEHALDRDQVPAELPELRGRLIGDMDDIYCTICQKPIANWHIGEDALDALLTD